MSETHAKSVTVEVSAKEVEITLTPWDIPGADLSEPFDKHTVSQLRWWACCVGRDSFFR